MTNLCLQSLNIFITYIKHRLGMSYVRLYCCTRDSQKYNKKKNIEGKNLLVLIFPSFFILTIMELRTYLLFLYLYRSKNDFVIVRLPSRRIQHC